MPLGSQGDRNLTRARPIGVVAVLNWARGSCHTSWILKPTTQSKLRLTLCLSGKNFIRIFWQIKREIVWFSGCRAWKQREMFKCTKWVIFDSRSIRWVVRGFHPSFLLLMSIERHEKSTERAWNRYLRVIVT